MVRLVSLVAVTSFATCAYAGILDDLLNSLKPSLTSAKIQNDIKLSALKSHSKVLQGFGDKSNGTRVFGSKGHNASVDYVATLAKLAGYEVTRQTFPYDFAEVITQRFVVGAPIEISAMT
ncbi:Leucyl aminopeptidase yscIV, partial [Ceratobasidium sp. UAMH 11750]